MGMPNIEQFPHVRAMKFCIACGRTKDVGLLVCWPCHNDLKMLHDGGYGPEVDSVIMRAQTLYEKRAQQDDKFTKL